VAFYLIYITGILFLAVIPALKNGQVFKTLRGGALFGLYTYAT